GKPGEPAEDLYRGRHRATPGNPELLRKGCSRRLYVRNGGRPSRRVPRLQSGGHRRLESLRSLVEIRPPPPLEWRLPHRSGQLAQKVPVRRDGGDSARPPARDRIRRPPCQSSRIQTCGSPDRFEEGASADPGAPRKGPPRGLETSRGISRHLGRPARVYRIP